MPWDFETEPEFQMHLDWMDAFVRDEVEPLDLVLRDPYDVGDRRMLELTRPLMERVKERGLWACHLGPELGGQGLAPLGELALGGKGRGQFGPTGIAARSPQGQKRSQAEVESRHGSRFPRTAE